MTFEELSKMFDKAVLDAEKQARYYDRYQKVFRLISFVIRAAVVIALFNAAMLALESEKQMQADSLTWIAAAGVLAATDQLFVVTKNWRRLTKANLEIMLLIALAKIDWDEFKSKLSGAQATNDDIEKTAKICRDLVQEAREVSIRETMNWDGDLEAAMKELVKMTKKKSG
ncbi:SLATT domain-containing protein [Enterovibrio sp. ZSDZ42]|uniref:SLATT domain-containing protein n=1 Tax=Enterovibrio gelatinilyticus TaxID=2899819 RepID=A0ABT5QUK8_9GAMM|nr:SLATT domain-containing protein [Enterovibrio sp. ZSDZ42]MDD1791640.1 SLATT domain-containing protein [Enterovibrio sp. ZSDZ42]